MQIILMALQTMVGKGANHVTKVSCKISMLLSQKR